MKIKEDITWVQGRFTLTEMFCSEHTCGNTSNSQHNTNKNIKSIDMLLYKWGGTVNETGGHCPPGAHGADADSADCKLVFSLITNMPLLLFFVLIHKWNTVFSDVKPKQNRSFEIVESYICQTFYLYTQFYVIILILCIFWSISWQTWGFKFSHNLLLIWGNNLNWMSTYKLFWRA